MDDMETNPETKKYMPGIPAEAQDAFRPAKGWHPGTVENPDELTKCEEIARFAHEGQFRRDGVTPYIRHVEAVVSRVEGEKAKAVAWLHDVLEDTDFTPQDLLSVGISQEVVEAVKLLTRTKDRTYREFIDDIKFSKNDIALEVKVADLISNLSDSPSRMQIKRYGKALAALTYYWT